MLVLFVIRGPVIKEPLGGRGWGSIFSVGGVTFSVLGGYEKRFNIKPESESEENVDDLFSTTRTGRVAPNWRISKAGEGKGREGRGKGRGKGRERRRERRREKKGEGKGEGGTEGNNNYNNNNYYYYILYLYCACYHLNMFIYALHTQKRWCTAKYG